MNISRSFKGPVARTPAKSHLSAQNLHRCFLKGAPDGDLGKPASQRRPEGREQYRGACLILA
jgi:hypothetical protein